MEMSVSILDLFHIGGLLQLKSGYDPVESLHVDCLDSCVPVECVPVECVPVDFVHRESSHEAWNRPFVAAECLRCRCLESLEAGDIALFLGPEAAAHR